MKYGIIRGRHRRNAAELRGIEFLRCDVHGPGGQVALRVIPVKDLVSDPDSQLEFSYSEKWVRKLAANWDPELCGVLDVTPLGNGTLEPEQRHSLKLGKDKARRHVKPVEIFLNEVGAKDPTACAIKGICEEYGYEIGKASGGEGFNRIEAVHTLRQIHSRGVDHLRAVLSLNTAWRGEPKTNQNDWLGALSLFIAHGYAEGLSPQQSRRLKEVIPGEAVRRARGLAQVVTTGQGEQGGLAPVITDILRKAAGLRRKRKAAA